MKALSGLIVIFALLLASCSPSTPGIATVEVGTALPVTIVAGGTPGPFPTPGSPTHIPTLPSGLSPAELKYRLLDQYPDFFFCDPDYYPVARADEAELARERFPGLQADVEEFQAVLEHNGLSGLTVFSDEQKLLIYREHKRLSAITLDLVAGQYLFQLRTADANGQGFTVNGYIDAGGRIRVQQREPGIAACPICLAAGTWIDTPGGRVAVEDLQVGDPLWTADAAGRRVPAIVLVVARVPVPPGHQVVHIGLDDGRQLWASPGHPTADGRRLGALKVGDLLDGSRVTLIERLSYQGLATYDLLPSGETGFYWANGILIGSTLTGQANSGLAVRKRAMR